MCGHAGFQATTKNHRKGTKKVQKLRHGPWTTPFETRRLFLLQLMSLFEYLWFMTVYDWLMTLSDLDEIQIHNSDVFLLVLLTEPHQEEFQDQSGEQIKTRLLNFVPFQWTSKGLVLPIELESTPSMNPTWSNMGNFLMLFFISRQGTEKSHGSGNHQTIELIEVVSIRISTGLNFTIRLTSLRS